MKREVIIVSVLTGWQSSYSDTGELFGPIFARTCDLWKWQRENIAS